MLLLAARWTLGASHQHRGGKFITDTETWFNLKRRFPWPILRTRWLNVVDLDFQQNHVGLAETCNKHNISNHLCNVKSHEFQPWTAEQWSESYSNWQKRPQALHADMLPQVSSVVLVRLPVNVYCRATLSPDLWWGGRGVRWWSRTSSMGCSNSITNVIPWLDLAFYHSHRCVIKEKNRDFICSAPITNEKCVLKCDATFLFILHHSEE